MWTNCEERRKILVVKLIVESASENRKSELSNSSIRDELKFESTSVVYHGAPTKATIYMTLYP